MKWIPIKPGTDGAMALAMCRVIIDDQLYDKEFVEKYRDGFAGFRDHLRERITRLNGRLRFAACQRRRSRDWRRVRHDEAGDEAIFRGSGIYESADAGRACYILDAITGQVDKQGSLRLKRWAVGRSR